MIRLAWGLCVLSGAAIVGALVAADVLVHAPSSLILRTIRDWRGRRYARKWGLPVDAFSESTQSRVGAELRSDAVRQFGLSEWEWAEFVEAHPEKTEEAS